MKFILISVLTVIAFFGAAFLLTNDSGESAAVAAENVSVVDGVQIIEITARGGYQPRLSQAKSGIPTILRFNTAGTFDCSLAVRIPSLGISKFLASNGQTDIDLGTRPAGKLTGTCSMGMYRFDIDFQA